MGTAPQAGESAVVLAPDAQMRELIKDALEAEGLSVKPLDSDEAFYDHLVTLGYPDLVVLSAKPGKGGDHQAILMGLQASERRPSAVIVTNLAERDEAAELVRLGAYAAVVFPMDEDELRAVCRRALRQSTMRAEAAQMRADLEDFRAFVYSGLTHLFEGIMVVDPTSQVFFANKEAARLLQREREDLVGKRLDPKAEEGFIKALHGAREKDEGWIESRAVIGTGDDTTTLQTRAVLLRDITGKPLGGLLGFELAKEQ